MNFLLSLALIVPIFSAIIIATIPENNFKNLIAKFTPIFFCAILCGINSRLQNFYSLDVISFSPHISLSFLVNKLVIKILFLLNFIWLICNFYGEKFYHLNAQKNSAKFKIFLAFFIAFLSLIFLAKNLLTLLFAYNCLALTYYFLTTKFIFKTENSTTRIFSFLILIETILLLFAIIFTAKYGESISFDASGVLNDLTGRQTMYLFAIYFSGILLTIFTSSYLLYQKNFNFDPAFTYLALPLFFGFGKLCILIKIITEIFSIGAFVVLMDKIGLTIFEIIILINLLISLVWLLFSCDFKAIFFHLFFSQLIFAIFTIFIFALYDEAFIYKLLPNFILSITLIFLTFSNIMLYLAKAENKEMSGLFYDMKVTIALMLFGFLNLVGVAPALGAVEKFSLLKIVFQNNLSLAQIIFAVNFFCLFLFTIKLFFPFFAKLEIAKSELDKKLSAKIDSSASLMLAGLVVAAAMVLLPIIQFFYD